jgi:hypothetical protein
LASHAAVLDARPIAFAIVEVAGVVIGTMRTVEDVLEALSSDHEETDSKARVFDAGISSKAILGFDVDNLAGMEKR